MTGVQSSCYGKKGKEKFIESVELAKRVRVITDAMEKREALSRPRG
jgi:hypothetical protein